MLLLATYTLIYSFLKTQSQAKAAEAVKKAAKDIVVLKDDVKLEGPSLDKIVQDWKATEVTKRPKQPSCVFKSLRPQPRTAHTVQETLAAQKIRTPA